MQENKGKSMVYSMICHCFLLQNFHIQEPTYWNRDLWELDPKMIKVERFQSNNYKVGYFLF